MLRTTSKSTYIVWLQHETIIVLYVSIGTQAHIYDVVESLRRDISLVGVDSENMTGRYPSYSRRLIPVTLLDFIYVRFITETSGHEMRISWLNLGAPR